MPETLGETLRETVKLLYYQGLNPSVIIEQTGVKHGTLRTWINRYGWNNRLADAKQMLVARGTTALVNEATQDLAKLSEHTKQRLAKHLVKGVENLDKLKAPKGLKGISNHAAAINAVVANANKVVGWDGERDGKIIPVNILAGYDGEYGKVKVFGEGEEFKDGNK